MPVRAALSDNCNYLRFSAARIQLSDIRLCPRFPLKNYAAISLTLLAECPDKVLTSVLRD